MPAALPIPLAPNEVGRNPPRFDVQVAWTSPYSHTRSIGGVSAPQ